MHLHVAVVVKKKADHNLCVFATTVRNCAMFVRYRLQIPSSLRKFLIVDILSSGVFRIHIKIFIYFRYSGELAGGDIRKYSFFKYYVKFKQRILQYFEFLLEIALLFTYFIF